MRCPVWHPSSIVNTLQSFAQQQSTLEQDARRSFRRYLTRERLRASVPSDKLIAFPVQGSAEVSRTILGRRTLFVDYLNLKSESVDDAVTNSMPSRISRGLSFQSFRVRSLLVKRSVI